MKRKILVLVPLVLALFVAACATTSATPNVKGVITKMDGNAITVTPASGDPANVTVAFGTAVFWENGLKASRSDLNVGIPVHVYLSEGTQNAAKIVIAD